MISRILCTRVRKSLIDGGWMGYLTKIIVFMNESDLVTDEVFNLAVDQLHDLSVDLKQIYTPMKDTDELNGYLDRHFHENVSIP